MSTWTPPASITGLADGQTAIAAHLKDLAASLQAFLNGNIGNPNIIGDPTEKIAYSKLNLTGAILDADIANVSISKFTTLQAKAQSSPNNTVQVAAGKYLSLDGTALRSFAGGNSPVFPNCAAPGLNRIDILAIDDSATLQRTAGIEAASPVPPAYPLTQVPICEVFVRYNAGGVIVKDADDTVNSYIRTDARSLLKFSGLADGSVTFNKLAYGGATGAFFANGTTDLADPGTSFVAMTDMLLSGLVVDGSGSWGTGNRVLISYDGAIELKQTSAATNFPMAEIRLMKQGDAGSWVEIIRTCVDFRNMLRNSTSLSGDTIVVPVHIEALINPGIFTTMGFRVEWARTNGATVGAPTIRQVGVTYNRTLSAVWFNKPATS